MSDERLLWTVRRSDGGTDGPYSESMLRDLIAQGQVSKATLVRFGDNAFRPALEWTQLQGIDVRVPFDPMRLVIAVSAVLLVLSGIGASVWFFALRTPDASPQTRASSQSVDVILRQWPGVAAAGTVKKARELRASRDFSGCEEQLGAVAKQRSLNDDELTLFVECSTRAMRNGLSKHRERLLEAMSEHSDGRLLTAQGLLAASLGRQDQATAWLSRALTAEPRALAARLALATLASSAEEFFALLKPAIEVDGLSDEALEVYHQGALRFGHLYEDEQLLKKALAKQKALTDGHAIDLLSDLYRRVAAWPVLYALLSAREKLSLERQRDLALAAALSGKASRDIEVLAQRFASQLLTVPALLRENRLSEALAKLGTDSSSHAQWLRMQLLVRQDKLSEAATIAAALTPQTPETLLVQDVAFLIKQRLWPDEKNVRCKEECEPLASYAKAVVENDREPSLRLEALFAFEDSLHDYNPHRFMLFEGLLRMLQRQLQKRDDEADRVLLGLANAWLGEKSSARAAGDEGRVVLALSAFGRGKFEEAQRLLSPRIKDPEAPAALRGLYGRIIEGAASDVADEYWTERQEDDDFAQPAELAHARIAYKMGDKQRAQDLYRALFDEGLKSPEVLAGLLQSGELESSEGADK